MLKIVKDSVEKCIQESATLEEMEQIIKSLNDQVIALSEAITILALHVKSQQKCIEAIATQQNRIVSVITKPQQSTDTIFDVKQHVEKPTKPN